MKYILGLLLLLGFMMASISSCKTGYGCPAEEAYEKNKNKPLSTKRGESKLFKQSK